MLFAAALATAASASAQRRFQVGVRAGANIAAYRLPTLASSDGVLHNGRSKAGFEASLLARLAITRHLNIQTEFEYDRVNYAFRLSHGYGVRDITINANRIEIPLLLGLNLGPVRLFGGPSFRISHNEKSSTPAMLQIKFNDSKVALTGGLGLNIKRFFIEGRLTGYPGGSTNIVRIGDKSQSARLKQNLKWSMSAGVLF